MKKYLCLDIGTTTIGIASSDMLGIAHPKEEYRFPRGNYREARKHICELMASTNIYSIVIGYPLQIDRKEGERCESVRRFMDDLRNDCPGVMATIVFGAQPLMVKKQISKIVADYFDKDLNQSVVYLDSHKITEGNLIDECEQCSLNSLYKAVIVENCDFLTAEKNKGKMKYSDLLIDYLKNENANTKLIFSVIYDKKLDSRNKIYKLLSENGKILECKDLKDDDWNVYVTKYFEKRNVGIEKKAINEL